MQAYDARQAQATMDSFLAFNERFAKIRCDASPIHVPHHRAQWAVAKFGQQRSGLARVWLILFGSAGPKDCSMQ